MQTVRALLVAVAPSPIQQLLIHLEESMSEIAIQDVHSVSLVGAGETAAQVKIVADFGNSLVAGLVAVGSQVVLVPPFPALVGMRGANMDRLLAERGESTLRRGEYAIGFSGAQRFVGSLAFEAREMAQARLSEERYADGWNLPFLFALVGAAFVNTPGSTPIRISATLTTMVPAELWADQQVAVKNVFQKKHEFTYNGRTIMLTITKCDVERETFVAWHLLPPEERKDLVLLIDIGGGTAQAVVVRDGRMLKAVTRSQGLETILDDLPHRLTVAEREELKSYLRKAAKQAEGDGFTIVRNGKDIRIDQDAQALITQAAKEFLSQIKAAIPQDKRDGIKHNYAFGGGLYTSRRAYEDSIKDRETGKTRLKALSGVAPELVNVLGAAKGLGLDIEKIKRVS